MDTILILMARHQSRAIIPIEEVRRDYFTHLSLQKLISKLQSGEIALPMVRSDGSQKAMRGVHVADLAAYLDSRRAAASHDLGRLTCTSPS